MVRQQLAFLRQSHRVDAMRLERQYRNIRTNRDNHQGQEQIIASRQLGDQEDARQRGVHHARHHARHTQQGEVLLRQIRRDIEIVGGMREDKPGDTP